jgi:protein O-mannosyl-transferase
MKLRLQQNKLLLGLLLCLLALLAYWPVARCGFVDFDDFAYITENPKVPAGLTLEGVGWAFRTGYAGNWHPLTWLSHMLDAQLYSLQPAGHHLTSLFFHLANTLLLFLLFNRMTGALWRSAFVAGAFALHPLHVESVAWVSERKDVLSACFGLLCLLAYARYAEVQSLKSKVQSRQAGDGDQESASSTQHPATRNTQHAVRYYLLSLSFFALGLMSKPMLVTLPFLLVLLDYWPLQRLELQTKDSRLQTLFPLLREKLPFFLLSALSSAVTYAVQRAEGAVVSTAELSLSGRIANVLVAYLSYVEKLFWPANLACFYPRPAQWPVWQVACAAIVLAAVTLLALRLLPGHRYVAVGWFWFVGTLVPVIGLVQVGEQAIADRYTYLPSIGLFVLVSWSLGAIAGHCNRLKFLLVSASILSLAVLLVVTRGQVRYWQTSETLFRRALAVTENNPFAHCLLAGTLAGVGSFEEAEAHSLEALRLKPDFPEAQIICARVLAHQHKFEEAISRLSEVLRQNPGDALAHFSLGSVFGQQGDISQAIDHYRQALTLKSDYADAHFNLASLLAQQGDIPQAIDEYRQGLKSKPNDPDALNNLAWVRAANSNPAFRNGDEAVQLARRACELTGYRKPLLVGTLAVAYAEAGQFEEAVATAQKARDLALASGQKELAEKNQQLLELYRTRRAYHEPLEPSPGPPRDR